MGADGGTIAKRSELVSTKPEAHKTETDRQASWTHCGMTGDLLEEDVVSDWNGTIYNKTAVLRYLLGSLPETYKPKTTISQIRDVVELRRTFNEDGVWIDPVSRKPIQTEASTEPIAYLAECGHVCAAKTFQRVKCCPVCEQSFTDYVVLNPRTSEAEANNLQRHERLERLEISHSLRHKKRKSTKRRRENDNEPGAKTRKA